jgi:Glycosyltransferase
MKVLMIIDSLTLGGRERRLVELVKGLTAQGLKIEVVVLRDSVYYPEIYQYASKVHVIKRKIKKDPSVFFKIYKIYKEFSPDVIHSWGSIGSIYVLPIVLFCRVGFMNAMIADSTCKIMGKNWVRAKITFPISDVIVANSFAGLEAYGAKNKKNAYVIHNGYDFNRSSSLNADELKEEYQINTRYVVGMVAAFHERRDYHTYLKAAIRICQAHENITFLCVGDGPTEDECKSLVPSDMIGNQVRFMGFQKSTEKIISMFDIGVLLVNSNLIQEGLSNAIIEYMAHAKPVIATDSGGSLEIIKEGENGFFVHPYSDDDLIQKIELLLTDDPLRIKMGQSAQKQIKENFSFDSMINSTVSLYSNICKSC